MKKLLLALALGLAMTTHASADDCVTTGELIADIQDALPTADIGVMNPVLMRGFMDRLHDMPRFADVQPLSIIVVDKPGAENIGLHFRLPNCMGLTAAVPRDVYEALLHGNNI